MIFGLLLPLLFLAVPASALEIEAPLVPDTGRRWMPENTQSLQEGLRELLQKVLAEIRPDIPEASKVCLGILATVLLISMLQSLSSPVKKTADAVGAVAIASLLLMNTQSMIHLASETVQQIGDYGKLLLPVMTAALAAQGGITASAALYAGTAVFMALLGSLMGNVLVPGIYLYLTLVTGSSATGENMLKKVADTLKSLFGWILKTLLMVFTTYLSLTGVVSGTTDAAALKAAKVTMSSFVPVVGGILSEASEAVLVSAGLMKNAAGIYGILAVLALFLYPFLQIALHYLFLKLTAAVCSVFGSTGMSNLIDAFSSAMGQLLGMTGSACVMVLISTVCYLKGVS